MWAVPLGAEELGEAAGTLATAIANSSNCSACLRCVSCCCSSASLCCFFSASWDAARVSRTLSIERTASLSPPLVSDNAFERDEYSSRLTLEASEAVTCDFMAATSASREVSFSRALAGRYRASAYLRGVALRGAFDLTIAPASISLPSCAAVGSGLHEAIAGRTATFQISARDRVGNLRVHGEHRWVVRIEARGDDDASGMYTAAADIVSKGQVRDIVALRIFASASTSTCSLICLSVFLSSCLRSICALIYTLHAGLTTSSAVTCNVRVARCNPFSASSKSLSRPKQMTIMVLLS